MQFETRFNEGDTVFIAKRTEEYGPCPWCEGTEKVTLANGKTLDCWTCNKGQVKTSDVFKVGSMTVRGLKIEVEDGRTTISYKFSGHGAMRDECTFSSRKEARAECDRRNAEEKKPC